MTYEISRREVLNNLIRFKDYLLEAHEEKQKGERKYKVLLNRRTGDMRFAQRISNLEHQISRKSTRKEIPEDWKEIYLIVKEGANIHFEVKDPLNHALRPADVEPLAWKIASETVDILNLKAKEGKRVMGMLPEEVALHDLSDIHLSVQRERIEDLPGWMGSISRVEAEGRLTGKGIGTYLLREGDEITIQISFHFGEENLLSVHPYLMTVVENEEKIADILMLQTNKGWILYHDDPNLNDTAIYQYYSSPQGLLHALNQTARHPLL